MARRRASSVVVWLIAVACLVPTALVWRWSVRDTHRIEDERIGQLAEQAETLVTGQLDRFVDLLRAVEGLIRASDVVEQHEFADFVTSLDLPHSYPGADAVVVLHAAADGTIVEFAAPTADVAGTDQQVGRNIGEGTTTASQEVLAAMAASSSGRDGASATTLVPAAGDVGSQFFVVRTATEADQWVVVRVNAGAFLAALAPELSSVDIGVDDITGMRDDGASTGFTARRVVDDRTASVDVSRLGRDWRVTVVSHQDVLSSGERNQSWIALTIGLLASAGITGFAFFQIRSRRQALALAERASRSEALHRQLVDAAPVAIVEVDDLGRIRTWNAAATALFEIDAASAMGSALPAAFDGEPTGDGHDAGDRMDRLRDHAGERVVLPTPSGDKHVVAYTTSIVDGSDHGLVILVDQTEQQRLETQLVEAQKLEMFGRLAGGIAHDFNNFLTAVTGYIDIVLMRGRIEDADRNALLESRRAADRATAVVAQLLTISRRQVTMPEVVDVSKLVDGLAPLLGTVIGDRADLRIHTGRIHPPATVRIDRTHLEQILLNLVVNAGEAMLDAGHVDLWIERQGHHVVLRVVDDGPGMEETVAARVFEPFFTTKAGHGGTGLGLSTVYSIVTSADGTMELRSAPGAGATFEIRLPWVPEDVVAPVAVAPVQPAARGDATILVVEDEPAVRRLTTAVLQQHGYRVISASDADEATSLFLEHRSDIALLLSDVVLRGRSGPQLADELHRQAPELPVLFLSGYAEGVLSEGGRLPVGTRFLGKPFRSADLLRQVEDAVAGVGGHGPA